MIEAPLLAVAEFLKDIENSLSWDRFLVVSIIYVFYCGEFT